MKRNFRLPLPWILAALIFAFAFQGSRHIWDPDEGRYTAVASRMVENGEWLVPRLHDELPHFTKPPLTYWILAASLGAFGKNEWGARIPLALAYLAALYLLYRIGRKAVPGHPWAPPLVYGLSLLPWGAASLVTTDTFLALWETLAGWAFLEWIASGREGRKGKPLLLFWFWAGLGLAFLTKGPPGLMPLPGALAFLLLRGGPREVPRLFPPAGILLFLVLGMGWFLLVILTVPGLLDYFLEKEFLGRIFSGIHHRNPQWYGAFAVYIPTLLLGTLPWTFLLAGPLGRTKDLFHRTFWREMKEKDPEGLFLLLWFLLPLPLFFLARSRLPLYLLPLFAPLSALLARRAGPLLARRGGRLPKALAAWALLLLAAKGAAPLLPYHKDPVPLAERIRKAAGPGVREVVFAGTSPRYGLAFYLDVEVEQVDFEPPAEPPPGAPKQTVLQELSEKEPGRLFLARPWRAARLAGVLASRGYRAVPLGEAPDQRYLFFQVKKELD